MEHLAPRGRPFALRVSRLEAIPTRRRPFDDRWHEACAVAHRPDLPDGEVVEEILPGYRLGDRIVRPARVVVNQHRDAL